MVNIKDKPWIEIRAMLDRHDSVSDIQSFLDDMQPADLVHAVFVLAPDDQRALLSILRSHPDRY